ncbi:hypothetical protein RMATCC62417_09920 [Rhizopus microsporus]|nr:hypothetical protein RMATCC62417_09920 [Rhizopus microsporus]
MNLFLLILLSIICVLAQGSHTRIFGQHKLVAYLVDWDIPTAIPWEKLDHVAYAFAVPDASGNLTQFDKAQLMKVVNEAHEKNKGVSLAVGGWTGSLYFSSLLRTDASRKDFAIKLLDAVEEYRLNGLNIDWEYPNDPHGVSCNEKDNQDTSNFLAFIQLVRQMLDEKYPEEHKLVTTAVSTYTYLDAEGKKIEHLDEGWSKYMDAFYIMAYDLSGSFSTTSGANAPLNIGNVSEPTLSGAAAVDTWIKAGIPSHQVFLGVPFYGYTHRTSQQITASSGIHVPFDRQVEQMKGDEHDGYAADPCPDARPSYSGEMQWRTIEREGIVRNSSGWITYWDPTSQTPFAYKQDNQQFLTFDDPTSLLIKAQYAKNYQLGGVMLWSLEMDDVNSTLLNALQVVRT